ncbi:putative LRR receptor-like serine/threonine-protein kinase [Zea mays]|uniref:Putative LRR receptor-like serine/threonine-protein kinase n=1 Tax=Zea mays TaxID=4577 RepID=A0A3L6F2R7_MAIZE|nr:putative LRR receptor-like serine/threonine-protein kinase [Zea mays]
MGCFSTFCKKRRATRQPSSHHNEDVPGCSNITKYTYKELVRATNNFNPLNKIGEGGFGSVYKGQLRNGTVIAVKVLSSESRQGVREFLNELVAISDISHDNLVKLYGYCAEGDQRILVYNHLENNSLAQTLLGMAYFAYSVLIGRGYLAPEYAIRGQVTRKSDVYSFGVLLLEIVCGRSNSDTRLAYGDQILLEKFPEITNGALLLQTWMHYEQGSLERIIDRSLGGGDLDVAQACRFLKVGLLCTQDVTRHRPDMPRVVAMLTGEWDVEPETVSKPAIISDFMDLKVRSTRKASDNVATPPTSSSTFLSSLMAHSSPLLSNESTQASMAFTGVSDRE